MGSSILNQSCFECDIGVMKKIIPVHSYDYNKEGYVPLSCNNCGVCSDVEELIEDKETLNSNLSYRFIERILKIVCNYERTFDYKTRDRIMSQIKNQHIDSPYLLAEKITEDVNSNGYVVDFSFIINTIYVNLDPRFDFV